MAGGFVASAVQKIHGFIGNAGVVLAKSDRALGAPWSDQAILLLSFVSFMLGFFLLAEAIKTLKWRIPDAPSPNSGALLSIITSCVILSVWTFRITVMAGIAPDGNFFTDLLLVRSRELAPGFLLASFVPICVALFKLLTVVAAGPREMEGWATVRRPLLVVWAQTAFVLLAGAASVVTLIQALQR